MTDSVIVDLHTYNINVRKGDEYDFAIYCNGSYFRGGYLYVW